MRPERRLAAFEVASHTESAELINKLTESQEFPQESPFSLLVHSEIILTLHCTLKEETAKVTQAVICISNWQLLVWDSSHDLPGPSHLIHSTQMSIRANS